LRDLDPARDKNKLDFRREGGASAVGSTAMTPLAAEAASKDDIEVEV